MVLFATPNFPTVFTRVLGSAMHMGSCDFADCLGCWLAFLLPEPSLPLSATCMRGHVSRSCWDVIADYLS